MSDYLFQRPRAASLHSVPHAPACVDVCICGYVSVRACGCVSVCVRWCGCGYVGICVCGCGGTE